MATTNSQLNLAAVVVGEVRTPTHLGTDSLRMWREMVRRALGKAGISAKVAASEMGITEQQLSDQLNGREKYHLSFWRMLRLGRDFWLEALPLIAEFYGISIGTSPLDEEHRRIGKAYCELQQQVSRTVSR
jgi:hypothetical protein